MISVAVMTRVDLNWQAFDTALICFAESSLITDRVLVFYLIEKVASIAQTMRLNIIRWP